MSKLWTETAGRDRLHPVVIGFVWSSPTVLREHGPGTWDAISDCFVGNRLHHRKAGALLDWTKNASDFLGYARLCEELPSPASVASGKARLPVARPLCVTLSLSVLQWIDAKARRGDDEAGVMARDFLERALDQMAPEAASVAVAAALHWYEIPLADRGMVLDRAASVLGKAVERL